MNTQCLNSDIISTLPENITEKILTLMPIRDALRTSILSWKWRYSWRSMPKLEFSEDMVEKSNCDCKMKKYKVVSAIFHVLLLHNGPEILDFNCWVGELLMDSEFSHIISYLARGNKLKELIFVGGDPLYKLPVSLFSLQRLEVIHLLNCTFEPPISFNGFSRLKSMTLVSVKVSAQILQWFLSKCPQLELICLDGYQEGIDFQAAGNKFTFVDILQCAPMIRSLNISSYYMKYLCSGGMPPHKLPTSLLHLKHLFLGLHVAKQNEISSALCIIQSSPLLKNIQFTIFDNDKLCVEQNSANFLDPDDYSDLKLDHLEILEIQMFCNLPIVMDFVKLILAKSLVLKRVRIKLYRSTVDEELKMLRDLVLLPFPRASPSAKLTIDRVSW